MYHYYDPYHPHDPYSQTYTLYTSTTTVPSYTLQHRLMSLSDQQSRIYAERAQLAAEEERLRRLRTATLQRIRAQRLREALDESDFEDAVQPVYEEEDVEGEGSDEDQAMRETVMYSSCPCPSCAKLLYRGILNDARARRMRTGLPTSREYQREIQIREMLDPSPRVSTTPFNAFHLHTTQPQFHTPPPVPPQFEIPQSPTQFQDTPVVNEVPLQYFPFPPQPQYVPEQPVFTNKRGSRRNSVRRDSQFTQPEFQAPPVVPFGRILNSYNVLRGKVQRELFNVPLSIREDMPPTSDEQKTLQHLVLKLEDILAEVDAVELATESEEAVVATRKARRELVTDIVGAIEALEKHVQPGTPSVTGTASPPRGVFGDDDHPAAFDLELQQAFQEVVTRRRDEPDVSLSRRSVNVEDVPDSEY